MSKNKLFEYWKQILLIAVPVSLQNILIASLSGIDQIMVGQLGTTSVAGVGIGYKIPNLFVITITSIGTCVGIMVSQYFGAKNKKCMIESLVGNLIFAILVFILFLIPSLIFPKEIIGFFTKDTDVIPVAVNYYKILLVAFIPMTLRALLTAYIRSIKKIRIVVLASMASVAVNTGLNYVLIFGKFGMPKLGYIGAAIATVISVYVECIILIISFIKEIKNYEFDKSIMKIEGTFYRKIMIILIPVILNEFLWGLGDTLYSLIYSRMGTTEMAAMALTYPIQNACIGLFQGIAAASGIIVGNLLGEGNKEEAYNYSRFFMKISIFGGIILAGILFIVNRYYVALFNVDTSVVNLTYKMVIAYAFVVWIKISNMVGAGGIIRSGGETKITLYMDLLGTWVIGIPLGFIMAFVFNLSLPVVYMFISFEEFVRFIITIVVLRRKKWMVNLTAVTAN
ncbi:MATE family efflux transporter [Clostridium sp. BJN0001]|uniref:MATE family efflux transporter n=1 Tax=Clostridium sp. BJN0001 TaxID=2930219 RepID=UPI001FD0347A|nr:MATE family efflux transporter [Clostridium sp. BJN0001]